MPELSSPVFIRHYIFDATLVVYLYVLSMNAFVPYNGDMPEMMKTMVSSFTTIIGIMIPFYFGASAYVQGRAIDANKEKGTKDAETP
jgi:hypothetical protein